MDVFLISHEASPLKYLEYPIEKVSLEIKHTASLGEGTKNMARCPAFRSFFKNTFVYRSPIDFIITKDKENLSIEFPSQNEDPMTPLVDLTDGVVELFPKSGFFVLAEKSLEMDILPPFLSKHIPNAPSTFDVGKWTRSVHPAIIAPDGVLNVQRGDALFYMRFKTDKKINLKPVTDENVADLLFPIVTVRHYVKNKPLQFFYDIFEKNRLRSKLIKRLKG